MNLKINEKPYNGKCAVDQSEGFALETYFTIKCHNWTDNDGYIVRYEFFTQHPNDSSPIALSYNRQGLLYAQLPQGLESNDFKLFILVQVIDDSDAITAYLIPEPVIVRVKPGFLAQISSQLIHDPANSNFLTSLKSADIQQASKDMISMTSMLNNDNTGATDVQSKKTIKKLLVDVAANLEITDISSVKVISSVLSVLTENTDQVSELAANTAIEKTLLLSKSLVNMSRNNGFDFIKQAANKILDTSANTLLSSDMNNSSKFYQYTEQILQDVVNISSLHLSINQETHIKSKSIDLKISRELASDLKDKNITLQGASLKLPNLNTSSKLMIKSYSLPRVLKPSLDLENSSMVSLTYLTELGNEIKISNESEPFEIRFKRDPSVTQNFTYVSKNSTMGENTVYLNIDIIKPDIYLYFQMKPENLSVSYLILIKLDDQPDKQNYDIGKVLCPGELESLNDEFFYQIRINRSSIDKLEKRKIGVSISELGELSDVATCQNVSDKMNVSLFRNSFSYRIFSSGCYFMDHKTGKWLTDGLELIDEETNYEVTSCRSSHLTDFAGGFMVLPTEINFSDVFANASFTNNPTIYTTIIVLACIYILSALFCYYMDWLDKKKTKIHVLDTENEYFYEVVFFTGSRKHAGTKSDVYMNLYGYSCESGSLLMKSDDQKDNKYLFRRSGVDTFIFSTAKPLGSLYMCRIFHENNAKNRQEASWYLKHAFVTDLTTNQRFIFICEKWFSVDRDDGSIDRKLTVAGESEKKNLKYLITRQTKDRLSDGHLWFSILIRPPLSSFTRLDRLTCAFVLLAITMLANILYYDVDSSPKASGLQIGPFSLTPQQIGIGIMSNLICFPPSFLLIQLFIRSKMRKTRVQKVREAMEKSKSVQLKKYLPNTEPKAKKSKKSKKLELPWWFKIIAYILSVLFTGVSLFFIIVKGISFGDEKVSKWLSSFLISILTSFFLTQPIQVAAISFLLVLIFRKADSLTNFDDSTQLENCSEPTKETGQEIPNNEKIFSNELDFLKKNKYIRQKQAVSMIREIVCYSIFLMILFVVTYTNKDIRSFSYQDSLKQLFNTNSLSRVETSHDTFNWIKENAIPKFDPTSGFLVDQTSFLIGYPIIRQLRIIKENCLGFNKSADCFYPYGLFNQDKGSYGLGWSSNKTSEPLEESFSYKTSTELDSYPYMGIFSSFYGGGYAYIVNTSQNLQTISTDLTNLEENEWVNSQTRAILLEFSLYNVNINLFAYCTILFEFLPTGTIITSSKFQPVVLYDRDKSTFYFVTVFNLVYVAFICFFMVKEIRSIIKNGLGYFKQLWNYVEWTLFAFSWAILAIYVYRQYSKDDLFEKLKNKDSGKIFKLQLLSYWNDIMGILLGFLGFLGTLKFLKLLRFNNSIRFFMETIRYGLNDLIQFTLVFVVFWSAFAQLIYVIENDKSANFSSIVLTFETTFSMVLNKLPPNLYTNTDSLVQALYCVSFYLVLVFVLLNLLITLITEKYEFVRKKEETRPDSILYEYLKDKFGNLMEKLKVKKVENDQSYETYLDLEKSFENSFFRLAQACEDYSNACQEQIKNCESKYLKH